MEAEINEQFTLRTSRLLLRKLGPAEFTEAIQSKSDDELMRFFGFESVVDLEREKERFSDGATMYNKSFLYFQMIDINTMHVIGWCGFHTWYLQHWRAELGYTIFDPANRGKRFMTEVLPVVLDYGFSVMKLNRVEAYTAEENPPSQKLLLNNGFKFEGILKEHYVVNNEASDSYLYALVKRDFIVRPSNGY